MKYDLITRPPWMTGPKSSTGLTCAQRALIVELQLHDATVLKAAANEKETAADATLACEILERELNQLKELFPDRALGEAITVNANRHEEALEAAAFNWNFDEDANRVLRVPQAPLRLVTCTACQDNHPQVGTAEAPCGHEYCRGCLQHLFQQSMRDETLYPPRCCKNAIPLDTVRALISKALAADFVNRKEEMETRDRTYCHRHQCSAFIRPYTINGTLAHCPRCRATTCTDCKGKFHEGDCPKDPEMEQILATARQEKWQRCSECKRMVELKRGCNHITCLCKHDFCYRCGEKWKTCRCPVWDEDRLLERGQRIAPNIAPQPPQPAAAAVAAAPAMPAAPPAINMVPQQPVNAAPNQLQQAIDIARDNHACAHARFRKERGEDWYECEVCGEDYPRWMLQCRACLMFMCGPCRRNRL